MNNTSINRQKMFTNWLNQRIKPTTISTYIRTLSNYNHQNYRFKESGRSFPQLPKTTSFFDINDINYISDIITAIGNPQDYEFNSGSGWKYDHGNLSAALKQYLHFLKDSQIANNNTIVLDNGDVINKNTIWFGAPGTGKSYQLNELLKDRFADRYERVTFYADYLHSQFVGSYKPITVTGKDKDGNDIRQIEYQFRPGPFTRVLIRALNDPDHLYALVIEELNRAEAASVFGDVFQLLDRKSDGRSEYAITVSEDLREYLSREGNPSEDDKKYRYLTKEGHGKLQELTQTDDCSQIVVPSNMYILATMNSADQGVFPLDTAFKRRWDFEYVGIDNGEAEIKDTQWSENRKEINKLLLSNGIQEDKQMGPFFLGNKDLEFGTTAFSKAMKNKVIMYLFEDAAKYHLTDVFDIKAIRSAGISVNSTSHSNGGLSLQMLFDAWDEINYGIFQGLDKATINANNETVDETTLDDVQEGASTPTPENNSDEAAVQDAED